MARFDDYINGLAAGDILDEDNLTLLKAAYQDDITGANAVHTELNQTIETLNSTLTQAQQDHEAEQNRLKAANYNLMQQIPGTTIGDSNAKNEPAKDGPRSFDDLFTKKS